MIKMTKKSSLFIVMLTVLWQTSPLLAQRRNIVKVNYSSLPAQVVGGAYERVVSKRVSLQVSGWRSFNEQGIRVFGKTSMEEAYAWLPEIRYYFSRKAPQGVYLGGFYRYRKASFELDDEGYSHAQVRTYSIGPLLGAQALTLKQRLAFDVLLGMHLNAHNFSSDDGRSIQSYREGGDILMLSRAGIRFAASLGFAF